MVACDCSGHQSNPYPNTQDIKKKIVRFKYVSPLVLVRKPKAITERSGPDPNYIVGKPYKAKYKLAGDDAWRTIVVPVGMLTDLASVPRLARWYVGRVGRHLEAAILHDYLYLAWQDQRGGTANEEKRNFADRLFFTAMDVAHVPYGKRWAIFKVVDLFGRRAFKSREKKRYVDVGEICKCKRKVRVVILSENRRKNLRITRVKRVSRISL